ncbi:MAG: hypothetical protein GX621_12625 [Pirellulaceae bacterium]|nr:hypothetical protein [Pirellulaceae bacterium]
MNDSSTLAIVEETLMLVAETGEYHGHADMRAVMQEACRALASMRRRMLMSSDRHVVAAVGLTNVGKSTLLNALLGGDLAPRRNGPCTAAPIEFAFGETISVAAHLQRGLARPRWNCSSTEEIHQHLTELGDPNGDYANRGVRRVIVTLPHDLLANSLVISDTPGFGAVQTDGLESSHEESLKRYLRNEVSQVFWVVLADQGIGGREKKFHDEFFAEVCNDVVVTGCEDWDPDDRARFRRRFMKSFASRLPGFHFVSGLKGLEARRAEDTQGLESAGITALETRIRELSDSTGRQEAVRDQLLQLAADIADWMTEFRDDKGFPLRKWWRPDSWVRWENQQGRDTAIGCELFTRLRQTTP